MAWLPPSQRLTSGESTSDPRLDRVRRVDLRTLRYPVDHILPPEAYLEPRSTAYELTTVLDQGAEGACVGFGFAHELLAAPQQVQADVTLARETIYWAAQQRDPYPGGAYPGADPFMEGTSVVSASDVMRELGYYTAVHWALTFADLIAALGHYGPVVIGVDWYEGMSMPDADGFIRPTGLIRGGHCVCLVGIQFNSVYIPEIDHAKSWVIVHNSWGPDWGDGGRAKLSLADLAVLWPGGDFCIPVRAYS